MPLSVRFIEPDALLFADAARLRHTALYAGLNMSDIPDFDDGAAEARHLVALQNGKVVGYLRMNVRATTVQLRHLAVAESSRGSGVGRALVDAALARAREEGATTAWVNARFTAIGFWRCVGFTVTADALAQAEQTRLPHKRMQLQLRRPGAFPTA